MLHTLKALIFISTIFCAELLGEEKRIPGAIIDLHEKIPAVCPCEDGPQPPFYDCSMHPLISSCTTSFKTFECSESVTSNDCYESCSESNSDSCRCKSSSTSTCDRDETYCSEHCKYRDVAYWSADAKNFPRLDGRFANWAYKKDTYNGGTISRDCNKLSIFLDSQPYTVSTSQNSVYWADHYKFFVYAKSSVPLPAKGKTDFEFVARVSANGKGCQKFPFPCPVVNSDEDVRLANGGFRVFDPDTGLNFAFHLTNSLIYAVYEREISRPGVSGFAYFIPVETRKPEDINHMKLRFDTRKKEVAWYVDGKEVLRINKVGGRLRKQQCYLVNLLDGPDFISFPTRLYYGFGSFTFLDYYPPCRPDSKNRADCQYPCRREGLVRTSNDMTLPQLNPIEGPPELAHFYDYQSKESNRLWGQGSKSWIKSIRVTELMCYRVTHHRRRNGCRCHH